MIYLDNGATSFPKPNEVIEGFLEAATSYCANPGRSAHHMAMKTAYKIYSTRCEIGQMFGIEHPGQIVFTKNCTEAINLYLQGTLKKGDHVITTSMEHNSVVRPLINLKKIGVETTFVRGNSQGLISTKKIEDAIRRNTKLIVMSAVSNVTGGRMPIRQTGKLAKEYGLSFMVDAAQGAGHMAIDVKEDNIDALAVSGHKGLYGLQGTGFLYCAKRTELTPLLYGGTGSHSKSQIQPPDFPEGFEAGTLNSPGIIALGEAVRFIKRIGVEVIEAHERSISSRIIEGLQIIGGGFNPFDSKKAITIYGPKDMSLRTGIVAFNISGIDAESAAAILNEEFDIALRAGFHCSPMAHNTIGTGQVGCIRACPSIYTSQRDADALTQAVAQISRRINTTQC